LYDLWLGPTLLIFSSPFDWLMYWFLHPWWSAKKDALEQCWQCFYTHTYRRQAGLVVTSNPPNAQNEKSESIPNIKKCPQGRFK
jgi:hypothetical protein